MSEEPTACAANGLLLESATNHAGSFSTSRPNKVHVTAPHIIVQTPSSTTSPFKEPFFLFLKQSNIPTIVIKAPYPASPKIIAKNMLKNNRNQPEISYSL